MNSAQMICRCLKCLFVLMIFSTILFHICLADQPQLISEATIFFHQTHNSTSARQWRIPVRLLDTNMKPTVPFLLAGILSFIAASISSAGGIGGGGLFIPILTIVAGLDLKTASSFSAFMVTGGSIANVVCYMFSVSRKQGGKPLIDFDVALLSQPCVLLGVSCGVICNVVFPEWLITIFLVIFLGFCTFKTFKSGISYWNRESERVKRSGYLKMEINYDDEIANEPLLSVELDQGKVEFPWMKLGMMVLIWFSFFVLYLLRGNRYGQGIIHIEACGTAYWIISSIQIPLAIVFTTWILYASKNLEKDAFALQENGNHETGSPSSDKFTLPIMALVVGFLGGVFGIGGGMLISPLLLQIGLEPEVTAATCSFMVFFSSSMSAIQYLLLGMENVYGALIYSVICFVASLIGLILVQRAIMKHGRASIVVFSVGIVLALSTILITSFGAVDVYKDYISGQNMGFKKPC